MEVKIQEEGKAITLMCSLPESWDHFVTSISLSTTNSLEFESIIGALLSEEVRRKSGNETVASEAMVARGRSKERGEKPRGSCRLKSKGKKCKEKCWQCNKIGHLKKDCWKQKESDNSKKEANQVDSGMIDEVLFAEELCMIDETSPECSVSQGLHSWLLDSGASHHMCPHRNWFTSYENVNGSSMFMGNNVSCQTVGMGDIKIKMYDNTVRTLTSVRNVSNLKKNLISLGVLDSNGYKFTGQNDVLKVFKGALVVMKVEKVRNIYRLKGSTQISPNQQVQLEARSFGDSRKEGETSGEKGVEDTRESIEASEPVQVSEPVQQPVTLRRSTRERKTPKRYEDSASSFALITEDGEPSCYQEAVDDTDSEKWKMAMGEEMDSLAKNNTWDLVEITEGRSVFGCKWVFKLKRKVNGSIERYKVRLVAKGYSQVEGIDVHEIFSPVVKLVSIRIVLALTGLPNLELEQLDLKTTFIHGDLNEEIYMEKPEGFVQGHSRRLVCKLRKSLYGLRYSPRQWYKKFDSFMVSQNFIRSEYDQCVYFKNFNSIFIILALYVDDMLIVRKSMEDINRLKVELYRTFDMKDLGAKKTYLGHGDTHR
eukprot:PITA_22622